MTLKTMLGILLICFFLHTNTFAQDGGQTSDPPAATLTFEQLAKSAKVYFRDSTEFPMIQKTTLSISDPSGRVRKIKNQTLDYIFNGYNQGKKTASGRVRGQVSFWEAMRGAKMVKASLNSFLWMTIAGITLYSDPAEEFALESRKSGEGNGPLTARLTRVKPCPAFLMTKQPRSYFPDETCGTEEYQLQDDLSFQKFAIDVSGLPAAVTIDPFGRCTLTTYHAEVEFQKITLPGDKEPFLVPRQVTATLATNKGNVVIQSVYEAKQGTGRR